MVGIKPKAIKRGCKKTIYRGILLGQGPRQGEKVVVKTFTELSGTKEAWGHEVSKSDVTKQLAVKFAQAYPSSCKIRVVIPGIVELDKVSKFDSWLDERSGHRGLKKDEWISIEEHISGQIVRYCPWSMEPHNNDIEHSDHLQEFSHFTYTYSCGTMVACDFQGVKKKRSSSDTLYIFTDSILHSRFKLYGTFDMGEYGITEFFKLHKCTDVCKNWDKPTPLTPPPSFDEACALKLMNSVTPPPAFENIVFPSYSSDVSSCDSHQEQELEAGRWDRRRSSSFRGEHRRQNHTDLKLLQVDPPSRARSHSYGNLEPYFAQHLEEGSQHRGESPYGDTSNTAAQLPSYEAVVATCNFKGSGDPGGNDGKVLGQ